MKKDFIKDIRFVLTNSNISGKMEYGYDLWNSIAPATSGFLQNSTIKADYDQYPFFNKVPLHSSLSEDMENIEVD